MGDSSSLNMINLVITFFFLKHTYFAPIPFLAMPDWSCFGLHNNCSKSSRIECQAFKATFCMLL